MILFAAAFGTFTLLNSNVGFARSKAIALVGTIFLPIVLSLFFWKPSENWKVRTLATFSIIFTGIAFIAGFGAENEGGYLARIEWFTLFGAVIGMLAGLATIRRIEKLEAKQQPSDRP